MRPLEPRTRIVASHHVDHATLPEAHDLPATRDLNTIDQLAFRSDNVVDRASNRAGTSGARANPQIAVGVAARRTLLKDRSVIGQLIRAHKAHLRATGFAGADAASARTVAG